MQMQRSGRTVCMVKTDKTARVQFGTTQLSLLNRDKSGTPGQKRDKLASRKTSDFSRDLRLKIGTVPENPGRMVTLLLRDHFYTRVQIFIQTSPTLTKLCHTKRDHLAKFYILLEL